MELDEYHLVILRRPDNSPIFTEAELAEADPMVRAGRLSVELMQFRTRPGSIAAPGNRITVD